MLQKISMHPEGALRNLIAICIGIACIFVVQTMLLIAVPLYAIEMGMSIFWAGIILSVPHLIPLILAIPLGGVIARLGGRAVVLAGASGTMLGVWLLYFWGGLWGLVVAQIIIGVAHLLLVLAAQSIVSSLGTGKALETYFGWYSSCLSAGQLLGPLMAGWIIDSYSVKASFGVMGVVSVLAVMSSLLLNGTTKQGEENIGTVHTYGAQIGLLRTNSGVKVSIALTVAVMFALGAHGSFLPLYLDSMSISATTIGLFLSLRALCAMAVRPFMTSVIDVMKGRCAAMLYSCALVAAGLAFTGFTANIWLLGFFSVLIGFGSGVSQPLSMVVLSESVTAAQRPSALGMRLMGNRGVQFLAPFSLGALAEFLSYDFAFLVSGVFVAFFGFLIHFINQDSEKETSN